MNHERSERGGEPMNDERDAATIRFRDVLSAELGKIRTLPATWIAPAIAAVANTLLGVVAATDAVRVAGRDGDFPIERYGTLMLAPVYVYIAIAVFAAGSEYRAGQIRLSLAAVPRRARLFCAKLAAVTAVGAGSAILALLPGHVVRQLSATAGGDHGIGAVVAGLLASVTAYLLFSVVGFGFAIVARTVVAPLAVLFILPIVVSPPLEAIFPGVVKFLPHEAALSLLGTPANPDTALGRGGGLLLLTAWAALSVGGAWASLARRDA
jgi:ABC-2 type transport system permease protein